MWGVLLGADGDELGRTAFGSLRALVADALALGAAAVIVVGEADDERCGVDRREVERVRAVFGPLGVRLHDYVLFWGERAVSLRMSGQL